MLKTQCLGAMFRHSNISLLPQNTSPHKSPQQCKLKLLYFWELLKIGLMVGSDHLMIYIQVHTVSMTQMVMKLGGLGKIFGFKNLVETATEKWNRKGQSSATKLCNHFLPD